MAAYRQRQADAERRRFLSRCLSDGIEPVDAVWIADLLLPVGWVLALQVAQAVRASQLRLVAEWHEWEQIRFSIAVADEIHRRGRR
ncbi:MAG TPA: hypothetical protein VFS21_40250 [Roseiflexaceae bacterium]|nr:hypothetical protein [Roseiflexaceae bacterium]